MCEINSSRGLWASGFRALGLIPPGGRDLFFKGQRAGPGAGQGAQADRSIDNSYVS